MKFTVLIIIIIQKQGYVQLDSWIHNFRYLKWVSLHKHGDHCFILKFTILKFWLYLVCYWSFIVCLWVNLTVQSVPIMGKPLYCTECPNKHGNWVTISRSSLLRISIVKPNLELYLYFMLLLKGCTICLQYKCILFKNLYLTCCASIFVVLQTSIMRKTNLSWVTY